MVKLQTGQFNSDQLGVNAIFWVNRDISKLKKKNIYWIEIQLFIEMTAWVAQYIIMMLL